MKPHNLFLLSLGCSKNTVDAERLTAQAEAAGLCFTETVDEADTVIINTCGFIADAKEESVGAILAAIDKKNDGTIQRILVMGCLPELYRKELQEELPEIDYFFGTRELPEILTSLGGRFHADLFDHRTLLTPPHYAFLKIAEGCNRSCSFCSIPKIRGAYRSQPIDQLLREAKLLQQKGVRELNIIAQDITMFGYDTTGSSQLNNLLLQLSDMGFDWLRMLYAYPVNFPVEVIKTMNERSNICNYLDIPLQHGNDRILRSMKRGINKNETIALLDRIRTINPDIRLRSTMIAGYPGETREEFEELLEFIQEIKFDRLGCFPYHHEEHAPSFSLKETLTTDEKGDRVALLMECQQDIATASNERLTGKTIPILIESIEDGVAIGRTEYDAPEVDNECLIELGTTVGVVPGSFCLAAIEHASPHDISGRLISILKQ